MKLLPYWQSPNKEATLYHGDACNVLRTLPVKSFQCIATSPPYWGLRDYGEDGQIGAEPIPDCETRGKKQCGRCFVCAIVKVCRELKRVLRDDGVFWLNLGDTYGGCPEIGLDAANLVGVPWRVALALQNDGWVLRQDVIWNKPDPMMEPVENRCTKSHEYVFQLTKSANYFYDNEAIKEESKSGPTTRVTREKSGSFAQAVSNGTMPTGNAKLGSVVGTGSTKNRRSVWTIGKQSYTGAHFACFPPKLVEYMILAGTSEHGCCASCNTPYGRVVEKEKIYRDRPNQFTKRVGEEGTGNHAPNDLAGIESVTVGWRKSCSCATSEVVPCSVLDPFVGSGTTLAVAIQHGRVGAGIDLSEKYLNECAIPRISEALAGEKTKKKSPALVLQGSAPKLKTFGVVAPKK